MEPMSSRLSALWPSRSVPVTSWRSASRWRTRPSTFAICVLGLYLFGAGEAFLLNADLGVSPWTVLAQGLSERTGLAIGLTSFGVSCIVLLAWIPLRERPGLGTITNIIVISASLQLMSWVLPHPGSTWLRLLFVLLGIAIVGVGSGLYLTCNLGPGPRDGAMTGLHQRFDWPVAVVRFGIEAIVLVAGWLLGGTVGIGTVLFMLLIGPSVGYGLRLAGRLGRARTAVPDEEFPEFEA